jgi:hypothetical protein
MSQTTLNDPYRLIDEFFDSVPASAEGFQNFDITWSNDLPIDSIDYQNGQYQLVFELELNAYGLEQSYIGLVVENPERYQYGSICFERDGYVEGGSREILQYGSTRYIWRTEVYRLSDHAAAKPKSFQLAELPALEVELVQPLNLNTVGRVELVPHKAVPVGGDNAVKGEWIDINQQDQFGTFQLGSDSELTIGKQFPLIPTDPLSTVIGIEQSKMQLTEGLLKISEIRKDYETEQVGTINMYKERDAAKLTLYQGVACDYVLRIYQTGIFTDIQSLPTYPTSGGGSGGGGGGGV